MSAYADITNNKSRLLTQSPRIRNSLRYLLIRVARPIAMCLRMQACFTTWLLSGTFIVNQSIISMSFPQQTGIWSPFLTNTVLLQVAQ